MTWKQAFGKGKEVSLATSCENIPNSNIVISLGFVDDKLLFADCQMKHTIRNLEKNKNICVIEKYFRLRGTVEIFSEGKYVDLCKQENDGYEVKNAILKH